MARSVVAHESSREEEVNLAGIDDRLMVRYSLLQVPFYFSALVLVSALASQKRHGLIALSGSINLLSKVPLALLLVGPLQLTGLVLSTVLMYALSAVLLYLFVKKIVRGRHSS